MIIRDILFGIGQNVHLCHYNHVIKKYIFNAESNHNTETEEPLDDWTISRESSAPETLSREKISEMLEENNKKILEQIKTLLSESQPTTVNNQAQDSGIPVPDESATKVETDKLLHVIRSTLENPRIMLTEAQKAHIEEIAKRIENRKDERNKVIKQEQYEQLGFWGKTGYHAKNMLKKGWGNMPLRYAMVGAGALGAFGIPFFDEYLLTQLGLGLFGQAGVGALIGALIYFGQKKLPNMVSQTFKHLVLGPIDFTGRLIGNGGKLVLNTGTLILDIPYSYLTKRHLETKPYHKASAFWFKQ